MVDIVRGICEDIVRLDMVNNKGRKEEEGRKKSGEEREEDRNKGQRKEFEKRVYSFRIKYSI